MEIPLNSTLIPFSIVAAFWLYRSYRAIITLRCAPVVKAKNCPHNKQNKLSVIIPARNEEKNIEKCVTSILKELKDDDEIIVINDRSTDKTESILKDLGGELISPEKPCLISTKKIKYLNSIPHPEGWTGKNFALYQGVRYASGNWFLFTDADTVHYPDGLYSSLNHADKKDLVLLTLFPKAITKSFWEHLIQPCAMAFLGLWFPIEKINNPKSKVYFGNGQYLLIKKSHYEKIGGHAAVKEKFLEDFWLVKKTKEIGARSECAFEMDIYGTRMYDSFSSIWNGWRRIFLHAFEQKPLPLLARFFSTLFCSVIPFACFIPLSILASNSPSIYGITWALCLPLFALIFVTAWKATAIVKAKKIYALLHPLASLILAMILLDAFFMAVAKTPTKWR